MDLVADLLIYGELHGHDWSKQGEHDGRCWRSRWAFIAWHMLHMRTKIESDLPPDHRIDQYAYDSERSRGGNAFRLLEPHRAARRRVLNPAQVGFHTRVLRLVGMEQLSICTDLGAHCDGQNGPAMGVGRRHVGFDRAPEAIADGVLG
jgi:hypothetical protein